MLYKMDTIKMAMLYSKVNDALSNLERIIATANIGDHLHGIAYCGDESFKNYSYDLLRPSYQILKDSISKVSGISEAIRYAVEMTSLADRDAYIMLDDELTAILNNVMDPEKRMEITNALDMSPVHDYINSLGGWDFFMQAGTQYKDMAIDTFKSIFTGEGYEYNKTKKVIGEIIRKACGNESMAEKMTYVNYIKSGVGILNDFSKNSDTLDPKYKAILEGWNVGFKQGKYFIKGAEVAPEVIEYLLTDYTKNVEYLESLERTFISSGLNEREVCKIIGELKVTYSDKLIGSVNSVVNEGFELIGDKALDKVFDAAGGVGLAFVATDFVMDVTGQSSYYETQIEIETSVSVVSELKTSLYLMEKKIMSGDYTAQDLIDYQNTLEITKASVAYTYENVVELQSKDLNGELYSVRDDYYKGNEVSIRSVQNIFELNNNIETYQERIDTLNNLDI